MLLQLKCCDTSFVIVMGSIWYTIAKRFCPDLMALLNNKYIFYRKVLKECLKIILDLTLTSKKA